MESLENPDHQDPLVQDHQEVREDRDCLDHKDLSVVGVFLVQEVINMVIVISVTEHFLHSNPLQFARVGKLFCVKKIDNDSRVCFKGRI